LAAPSAARHALRAVFPKSFASEFPHDNADLSEGVTWMCTSVSGRPQPQTRGELMRPKVSGAALPSTASEPLKARPLVRVKSLRQPPDASPATPFDRFVAAMVRVALAASATHVAAELPAILRDGRLRPAALGSQAEQALAARGYLGPERSGASASFITTQAAWRDALSGSSGDLAACGATTLDEWGAALLAALLAHPASRADELKRALRVHGVAAFGVREAA
jgi:hypothetical protein